METVRYDDINNIYQDIIKRIRNKNKLINFERYKVENINNIINILNNNNYNGGIYKIFIIKEPKIRVIMALKIEDKIINHYVNKYILEPKLTKYLDIKNIATRKGMGTEYGIKLIKKYLEENKKYEVFYILKIDIKKYFYNIDHKVLLNMLKKDLDSKEYKLIESIIKSTNKDYINKEIAKLREKYPNNIEDIPFIEKDKSLPIGNLTSQFLAIFYLNKLDHYIIHNLHLKYYLRYMDDFIIIHHDKQYLKYCLSRIIKILNNYYKLDINNKKTKITNNKQGFCILGYRFRVINKKTIINIKKESKNRIKRKIKENKYLLNKNINNYEKVFASINNYLYSYKYSKEARNLVNKYFWGS